MSLNVGAVIALNDQVTEQIDYGAIKQSVQGNLNTSYQWTNGTATKQIDLSWQLAGDQAVTLASSASVTYTLSALTDSLGRAIAFARVDELLIVVTSRTGSDTLTVGAAGTHPWTAFLGGTAPTVTVADALCVIDQSTTAMAVSSGSSDQLKIVNSGSASITFAISIKGRSV